MYTIEAKGYFRVLRASKPLLSEVIER